jgi:hypothetical protein
MKFELPAPRLDDSRITSLLWHWLLMNVDVRRQTTRDQYRLHVARAQTPGVPGRRMRARLLLERELPTTTLQPTRAAAGNGNLPQTFL